MFVEVISCGRILGAVTSSTRFFSTDQLFFTPQIQPVYWPPGMLWLMAATHVLLMLFRHLWLLSWFFFNVSDYFLSMLDFPFRPKKCTVVICILETAWKYFHKVLDASSSIFLYLLTLFLNVVGYSCQVIAKACLDLVELR